MSPHWERITSTGGVDRADLVFDATLSPNRSLSQRWFWRLIGVVAALEIALACVFWAQGAYPVSGFLLAGMVALIIAFRVNYAAGRAREIVQICPARVMVERRPAFGAGEAWQVSPQWAQVAQDSGAVRIASAGRALRIGAFLSPQERDAFAAALRQALARARATPRH